MENYNFYNQRVLLRCDFNVPMKSEKIADDFRLKRTLSTIIFLKKAGAKIILLSHLGEPQSIKSKRKRKAKLTLKPIGARLSNLLREKVLFSKKNKGLFVKRLIKKMKPGDILLLENLRFDIGEEQNCLKLAKSLACLADVYVNDAFGACHLNHASIAALPGHIKHFAGPELLREFQFLSRIMENPVRPLVALIGGTEVALKIRVLKKFLKRADYLLLSGELAKIVLAAKGLLVGRPFPSREEEEIIGEINLNDPRIYLPIDVLASTNLQVAHSVRQAGPATLRKDEDIFDIGPETTCLFRNIINQAGSIFWSGHLGCFKKENFSSSTKEIAQAIADSPAALRLAGGEDTIAALRHFDLADRFSFVSTSGEAMLAFLSGEKLPGLTALGL
ncbi:phosphoglycerate kinase [bacterium (Candidatus Gribaldobacteria) CG08_land_8_20_14_0_20_39_15]|uniref:Phosphoglycerate kinase n=1 Tax=bacterium (Candidatus Gribaldobacteria) CG08_land_8_20_14_0_20_39_15 TaxID=2014273 RepID=A0A2M6XUY7_9BACT|nr:MAG: phosphoglycerate kinase [bacterium (Candidatus Gribaldobacteria) CG08_land_8_20_14_0_20_39_15]